MRRYLKAALGCWPLMLLVAVGMHFLRFVGWSEAMRYVKRELVIARLWKGF
jgi:hypothetical protein